MTAATRRILVVDDLPAIHEDFRKILLPPATTPELDDLEAALFDAPAAAPTPAPGIEVASAYQGQEALALVLAARRAGRPFDLAFIDMRMPPGWDGLRTIEQLWQVEPQLHVVICSAYSDQPMEDVLQRLEGRGTACLLPKPFDPAQVRRLAAEG